MSEELDVRSGRAAGLKAQILDADDGIFEDVDIPEWSIKVRVRGLSGIERDAFEAQSFEIRKGSADVQLHLQNYRARLVVRCLYDPETDERIFANGDAAKLGQKPARVIDPLFDLAQKLSGMDNQAQARAEGNSETDQNDSSTSD